MLVENGSGILLMHGLFTLDRRVWLGKMTCEIGPELPNHWTSSGACICAMQLGLGSLSGAGTQAALESGTIRLLMCSMRS